MATAEHFTISEFVALVVASLIVGVVTGGTIIWVCLWYMKRRSGQHTTDDGLEKGYVKSEKRCRKSGLKGVGNGRITIPIQDLPIGDDDRLSFECRGTDGYSKSPDPHTPLTLGITEARQSVSSVSVDGATRCLEGEVREDKMSLMTGSHFIGSSTSRRHHNLLDDGRDFLPESTNRDEGCIETHHSSEANVPFHENTTLSIQPSLHSPQSSSIPTDNVVDPLPTSYPHQNFNVIVL